MTKRGSYQSEGAHFWSACGKGVLENIMPVSGGDKFNVTCIEEAVC